MRKFVIGALAIAGAAAAHAADESFPLPSVQPGVSAAANTNALDAADPSFASVGGYMLQVVRVTFNTTEINGTTNDFFSDQRLRLWQPGSALGAAASLTLIPSGSGYTGTAAGSALAYLPLSGFFDPAGTWNYRFSNTPDDAPTGGVLDNELTDILLEFNPAITAPTCVDLGDLAGAANINFNTEGSVIGSADTEIGVFTASGLLLGSDDDGGTGNLSSLNLASLPNGVYYIAVAGWNATFGNGFAVTTNSTTTGNIVVNVSNGVDTLTGGGALASGQVQWYCVTIPEPTSLALLGLAALALRRR